MGPSVHSVHQYAASRQLYPVPLRLFGMSFVLGQRARAAAISHMIKQLRRIEMPTPSMHDTVDRVRKP
jgi:hypothetical protein